LDNFQSHLGIHSNAAQGKSSTAYRKFITTQITLVILLAALFGGASLISLGSHDSPIDPFFLELRYTLIGSSIFLLLCMSGFDVWPRFPKRSTALVLTWILFSFASILSSIAHSEVREIANSLWFLFGVPLIFFVLLPRLIRNNTEIIIPVALILGHMPFVIISLLKTPITYPYQGILGNPNQMGVIGATISASSLILLSVCLFKKQPIWQVAFILFMLVGSLALILMSGSRTSLLSFFIMLLIFTWKVGTGKYVFKKILRLFIPIIGLFFILQNFKNEITDFMVIGITNKFWVKYQTGDVLSERGDIWRKTFEDISILGNGSHYFDLNFGKGGHNTFIVILGENGIIAAVLFICFAVIVTLAAYQHDKKSRYFCNSDFSTILICFWSLSVGEDMFGSLGKGITLAFMLNTGMIIQQSNQNDNRHLKSR